MWKGKVRTADADAYADYIAETGFAEYERTSGNQGAWMLQREVGDLTEFMTFSLWESLDAVKAFAGDDYETRRLLPRGRALPGRARRHLRALRRPRGGRRMSISEEP